VELITAGDGTGAAGAWRPGLAALYAELGLPERAQRLLDQLVDRDLTQLPRDATFVASLSYLADAAVLTGDRAAARELYAALSPYRGSMVILGALVACYGSVDRYLGSLAELLGRDRDAEEHFVQAIEQESAGGITTWLAHSRFRYAAFLARQARNSAVLRAIPLLQDVLDVTATIGMVALARRAGPLLDELTANEERTMAEAGLLSERELEVVHCLAEGLSNAAIGRRLNISQHTAANHIRSILMKTGCANRTEVAAWAVRRGLVAG
jgi:DNA-binding NarL/FixJ family response regulator